MRAVGYVYLLHFDQPIGSNVHHARHYIGWAGNWVYRVQAHRRGDGRARLPRVFWERSIGFRVAVVVIAPRAFERRLKDSGHYERYCPLCGGHALTDYRDLRVPA